MSFRLVPKSVTLNGIMALFCVISANLGSFRAHCIKVHVRYLISWWVLVLLCHRECNQRVYICLSGRTSWKPHVQTPQNFLYMLLVAVAQSSSNYSWCDMLCTSSFVDDVVFSRNRKGKERKSIYIVPLGHIPHCSCDRLSDGIAIGMTVCSVCM